MSSSLRQQPNTQTTIIDSLFTEEYDENYEQLRRQNTQKKREEFLKALGETLKEDKDGEKYGNLAQKGDPLDQNGNLTQDFKDELKELKMEELLILEESIKNARQPSEDLFGIERRFCNVCEEGCIGYQPHQILFPSQLTHQFPTFCKNCKCPAYFHQMTFNSEELVYPEDLIQNLKNYNITSKDLNFNCVLATFQVRNTEKEVQNLLELTSLLKDEGFEVLSVDKRLLEFEEAIYFKSRMVGQTENLLLQVQGESQSNYLHSNDIRKQAQVGSTAINKSSRRDTYLLDIQANEKESQIRKAQQKLMGQKAQQQIGTMFGDHKKNESNSNQGLTSDNLKDQTINQRLPLNATFGPQSNNESIARTSLADNESRRGSMSTQLLAKRMTVLPKPKDKYFKLKTFQKDKQVKKKAILQTIPEDLQEGYLTREIEFNPILKELLSKEVFLVAIGSSTFQNLDQKLRKTCTQRLVQFLPPEEMPLLYISENKVMAIEDTITFFPQLFRLTKSIIVSEPTQEFYGQHTEFNSIIKSEDPSMKQLQKKISSMSGTSGDYQETGLSTSEELKDSDDDLDNNDNHFFKKRNTIAKKFSTSTRQTIKKRQTLKGTTGQAQEKTAVEEMGMDWVERARNRETKTKKAQKMSHRRNKMLFNFGMLQDFFNYSAVAIQAADKEVDFGRARVQGAIQSSMSQQNKQLSNLFAIAKVGLPNLIFPTSLDMRIANHQKFTSYTYLSDTFFPTLSHSQHQVIVLRPIIVKNGLNELFVQILKANDFVIVKRKIRMLRKTEAMYLAKVEGVTEKNSAMYYNMMLEGQAEILVLSKLGAVHDALTIVNGSNPHGRRRIAQLKEDVSNVRSNVDAVNAMFEINPFSSFNEFIDIEDFIVSHSRLEKYKKLYQASRTDFNKSNKLGEQLYFYKVEEIRKELNLFSRFFNLAAVAAPNEYEAHKQMCVLMPETATIEEVVLILNPLYNNHLDSAVELLLRMGFHVLEQRAAVLDSKDVGELFKDKLNQTEEELKIQDLLTDTNVHIWHLTKIAADREIRATYKEAQIDYDDLFEVKVQKAPFKPMHLPYLFIFMDTPLMFEKALSFTWPVKFVEITGQDLLDALNNKEKVQVLDMALQATVGDRMKVIEFDRQGNVVPQQDLEGEYNVASRYITKQKQPQMVLLFSNSKDSNAVHYEVESTSHGLFEIRFHRLPHKGDCYNHTIDPSSVNLQKLSLDLYTQLQTLNYYYNEVNKVYYNICPAFYRFKVCPLEASVNKQDTLNRVYEVEEYMGRVFIEEIADLHQDHLKMLKHTRQMLSWQYASDEEQRSLPAYIWGLRLSEMCKSLETIRGNNPRHLKGAGRIEFSQGQLQGEVPKTQDYYAHDKQRYLRCLEEFRKGWHYYLSVLETDIIEQKLLHILNSFTFKYSRMGQFISLIPDKVNEVNLRISEKVKVINDEGLKPVNREKFFTHLKEELIDPHREEKAHSQVESMMHTLNVDNIKKAVNQKLKDEGTSLEEVLSKKDNDQYSIHKDCALVGVEVARRPKYQLIASILYLINFTLRKIDRRSELFAEADKQVGAIESDIEKDYDKILDIMFSSMTENYGEYGDEYNFALDMISLEKENETEFEKMMRTKTEQEQKLRANMKKRLEDEDRKKRATMTMEQLLKTQIYMPQREYEMKQRDLLRKFVDTRGHQDRDGDGFLQVLRETQSMLGDYSMKLAHDYIKKSEKGAKGKQEKISFVKMEYFLYGITQAFDVIQNLKNLESRVNSMQDRFEISKKESLNFDRERMTDTQRSGGLYSQKQQSFQASSLKTKNEELLVMERQIERMRYTISMKETELVLIFRELMSWDYYVPDHYFDTQLLSQKHQRLKAQETYLLPLKTFWLPIDFDDPCENDLFNPKYHMTMREYTLEDPKILLPPALTRQPFTKFEHSWKNKQGVTVANLRPHDIEEPDKDLKFDKYYSKGEMRQTSVINDIKSVIKEKTAKTIYRPTVQF